MLPSELSFTLLEVTSILGEGRGCDQRRAPVSMFKAEMPRGEVTRKLDLSRNWRVWGGEGESDG